MAKTLQATSFQNLPKEDFLNDFYGARVGVDNLITKCSEALVFNNNLSAASYASPYDAARGDPLGRQLERDGSNLSWIVEKQMQEREGNVLTAEEHQPYIEGQKFFKPHLGHGKGAPANTYDQKLRPSRRLDLGHNGYGYKRNLGRVGGVAQDHLRNKSNDPHGA